MDFIVAVNNFGDTRSGGLAGPMGLFIIVLLSVATVLLIRNMNKRLRRLPDSFPDQRAGVREAEVARLEADLAGGTAASRSASEGSASAADGGSVVTGGGSGTGAGSDVDRASGQAASTDARVENRSGDGRDGGSRA